MSRCFKCQKQKDNSLQVLKKTVKREVKKTVTKQIEDKFLQAAGVSLINNNRYLDTHMMSEDDDE